MSNVMRLHGLIAATIGSVLAVVAACGTDEGADFPSDSQNGDGGARSGGSNGMPGIQIDDASGGGGGNGDAGCGPNLTGIVRDFKAWKEGSGHPDFEHYLGGRGQKRMVLPELGADFKPRYDPNPDPDVVPPAEGDVYAPGAHKYITSEESFGQWYRTIPGVNQAFEYRLELVPSEAGGGISTFASESFFPIDGKGWGTEGLDQSHNFGFTFELHTEFKYQGGEVFTFSGDDDLWTFIAGKLAIDLGGIHSSQSANVTLDEIAESFGLVKGQTYPLDVFHAERHTIHSNFRIDTSIEFTNCSPIVH